MQKLLQKLQKQKNWKQFLKKSCRKNKLTVEIASYFTPLKIRSVYERFLSIYEKTNQNNDVCWLQNQLKTFHWVLVAVSGLKELQIEKFSNQQWSQISQIFKDKDYSVLEYESIKLVNERVNKNRSWQQEQTEILTEIINENQNSNKWNDIARKLFQRSNNKFFRSGKQCRQRWLNHLDPTKVRGFWTDQQDKTIVNYILKNGRKWSNIAKEIGSHRTQHMVKNRYKTLIIKQKKLSPKITNQNTLIKQIGKKINGQDISPKANQNSNDIKKQDGQQVSSKHLRSIASNLADQQKQSLSYLDNRNSQNVFKTEMPSNANEQKEKEKLDDRIAKDSTMKQMYQTQDFPISPFFDLKNQKKTSNAKQDIFFTDPILSQVIEQCPEKDVQLRNKNSGSSNYQMQQIYSPFMINYHSGITPTYLSPSPSVPFFMNSSFTTFDNQFNQNLFMRDEQNIEKGDDLKQKKEKDILSNLILNEKESFKSNQSNKNNSFKSLDKMQ